MKNTISRLKKRLWEIILTCAVKPTRISRTSHASLWVFCGARRMQTVCLSGQHSQELLVNKGCRLPFSFAWKPSEISPTTHRASLRRVVWCEADANCLPIWMALTGAACQQRLPPSSLLCSETDKDLSDKSASKLAADRWCEADANCLPVWLVLSASACQQRLPPSSLLCTGAVRDLSNKSCKFVGAALCCEADANCLPV